MTYEEMKKMLDGLKQKKRLMRSVQRQIEEAREQIDCLNGRDYGGAAVQGGVKEPAAERFIEHRERLERRYGALMTEAFWQRITYRNSCQLFPRRNNPSS